MPQNLHGGKMTTCGVGFLLLSREVQKQTQVVRLGNTTFLAWLWGRVHKPFHLLIHLGIKPL